MIDKTRPNVVVIVVHDLGDYLGCYGHKVDSPNLDRFAAEGVRFANHFSTAAMCSPARGSIITGRYPHANGLMGLCNLGWDLPAHNLTDAQRFEEAGYRTALVGFQHEKQSAADLRFQQTWSRVLCHSNYSTDHMAECADELLGAMAVEQQKGQDQRPFYLRLGTYSVHRNLAPVSGAYGYDMMHDRGMAESDVDIMPQWMDTPGLRYDLAGFTGDVNNMDRGVGVVLDAIRKHGFEDDTLVVFTTDHGIDFPRAKSTLYDLGTRTALLMRWPRRMPAGSVVSGLTSHIDILPTILDACGATPSPDFQGASLLPLIDGTCRAIHDYIFTEESTFPNNLMRAVRSGRFKLIRNYSRGKRSLAATCLGGRTEIDTGNFYFDDRPEYEFYCVEADPHELTNISGCGKHRQVEAELREQLDRWLTETQDPILTDSIRRPEERRIYENKPHPVRNHEHWDLLWWPPSQSRGGTNC
ncbi:sulfatase [Verrucomicrobiota bacterium]